MPPPTIDGQIIDEAWMKVEPYSTFTQTDPIEGAPATERTEVRVLFDKAYLYIGVICFDSEPDKIIVNQCRRDAALTETDAIIMVLDTFNDNQNAFVSGPLRSGSNTTVRSLAKDRRAGSLRASRHGRLAARTIGSLNLNGDATGASRRRYTERGWEAYDCDSVQDAALPTGINKTWGFNVKRNIRRKNEQVFLSRCKRGFDIYRVSSAAKMSGLNLPPP